LQCLCLTKYFSRRIAETTISKQDFYKKAINNACKIMLLDECEELSRVDEFEPFNMEKLIRYGETIDENMGIRKLIAAIEKMNGKN